MSSSVWAKSFAVAAIIAPFCGSGVWAQDGLRTTEVGATLVQDETAFNDFDIDLNFDDVTDFTVEITNRSNRAALNGVVAGNLDPGANIAYIFAAGGDGPFEASVFIDRTLGSSSDFAATFADGDVLGFETFSDRFDTASGAFLYTEELTKEGRIINGPFSETGDTGFIGLSLFNNETEETNFGFLEITRGSLTFGTLGYQQTSGLGAEIGGEVGGAIGATVPLPAPLALLGFAIAGLFGLRRFKA